MERPSKELTEAYDKLLTADNEASKWREKYKTLFGEYQDYKAQVRHQVVTLMGVVNG